MSSGLKRKELPTFTNCPDATLRCCSGGVLPGSAVNFNQFGCKISGNLAGLFHQAWERLVERHNVSTHLILLKGIDKPVQVVHKKRACRGPTRTGAPSK